MAILPHDKLALFDDWSIQAQALHQQSKRHHYHEREVWWAHLGKNIGWEQNGSGQEFLRPVLVIRKFRHELCWIVPVTQTIRSGRYYFELDAKKCRGQLILTQLKAVDSVRLVKKIERLDQPQFDQIRMSIRRLL